MKRITETEIRMIHAEYLAFVSASIEGRSLAVCKMLGGTARAEVAAAAMKDSFQGQR
jgi:hypothetical protein